MKRLNPLAWKWRRNWQPHSKIVHSAHLFDTHCASAGTCLSPFCPERAAERRCRHIYCCPDLELAFPSAANPPCLQPRAEDAPAVSVRNLALGRRRRVLFQRGDFFDCGLRFTFDFCLRLNAEYGYNCPHVLLLHTMRPRARLPPRRPLRHARTLPRTPPKRRSLSLSHRPQPIALLLTLFLAAPRPHARFNQNRDGRRCRQDKWGMARENGADVTYGEQGTKCRGTSKTLVSLYRALPSDLPHPDPDYTKAHYRTRIDLRMYYKYRYLPFPRSSFSPSGLGLKALARAAPVKELLECILAHAATIAASPYPRAPWHSAPVSSSTSSSVKQTEGRVTPSSRPLFSSPC
ncbi:hypothetical protein B0H13DRAFT_2409740 [Mycena leptocephala]|nr:hypothetical protein B0H13DRAFT_2409740 [Mycena leptocephala]